MNPFDLSTDEAYDRLYSLYRRSPILKDSVRDASTDEERIQEVQRVYQNVMGPGATVDPQESVTVIQSKFEEHRILVCFYNQLIEEELLADVPKISLKNLPYYRRTEVIRQWLADHRATLEKITYLQLEDFRSIPKELGFLPSLKTLFLLNFEGNDYTPLSFTAETFRFLILRLSGSSLHFFIQIDPTASHSHRVHAELSEKSADPKIPRSLLEIGPIQLISRPNPASEKKEPIKIILKSKEDFSFLQNIIDF